MDKTHNGLRVVTYAQLRRQAWKLAKAPTKGSARLALAIVGAPGVGKSALPKWLAKALKRPLIWGMNGSSTREDMACAVSLPDGGLARVPTAGWAQACREPCVIVIDEVSRIPDSDQAGPLSAIQDGVVGDSQLHPETTFILCWNDEGSTGAGRIVGAMRNRVCALYLQPTASEVGAHFQRRAAEESKANPKGAAMLRSFGVALEFRPDLLLLDPERIAEAEQAGQTWPSPRAWEKALLNGGDDEETDITWHGTVGGEPAAAFRGVLQLGQTLPKKADVIANPITCPLPSKPEGCVAAIGLIREVATDNPDAAMLYAVRLPREIRGALGGLTRSLTGKLKSPAAQKAQRTMLGEATVED